MRPLSFRGRLALTMGALILLIASAISVYVPRKLEQEAIALIAHKADTLLQLTVFTIHPALYFRDGEALEEALSGARNDKDVAYVVVANAEGRSLSAFHRERATRAALTQSVPGGGVSRDGSMYEAMTLVRDGNRILAHLHVGISLARLNEQVAQMRIAIGVWSVFILTAGLVAVVFISNLLTRPLRDVAAGAARIAAGQFGQRVPAARDDEIGQLAVSFNEMAANVASRDASLRDSREQLRQLSKRLLTIQEQERVRIAREVHDELGQALTAMKIDLQQIARRHSVLEEPLVPIAHTIDHTVDLVRRIAGDLRPAVLDDFGVSAALEQQLRRLRESSGIRTTLTVSEEPELDMLTGATLYRIAREALANVVRHADASLVEVSLGISDGAAVLEIRDDGRGITQAEASAPRSLGLLGIRERAELLGGSMAIEGRPGEGTTLIVTLPVLPNHERRDV